MIHWGEQAKLKYFHTGDPLISATGKYRKGRMDVEDNIMRTEIQKALKVR